MTTALPSATIAVGAYGGSMKPGRLIGLGLFTGFGMGQLTAWLMLRAECHNAAGMIALSTFGVGMTTFGLLRIGYLVLAKNH